MPTVLFESGFRFFFYLNEHEPVHIHVQKGDAKARIILVPAIQIDKNHGFKPSDMRKIIEIVVDRYQYLIEKWDETFNK